MLDLIPSLSAWPPVLAGQPFAVATIVAARGSVPRVVGTSMLVSASGDVLGSLSGGCVEGAVVALALEALDDGGSRRAAFGYSPADAFAGGLTCGGELEVHIEPSDGGQGGGLGEAIRQLAAYGPGDPVAVVRRLDAGGGRVAVIPDPAAFRVAESPDCARLLELPFPSTEPFPSTRDAAAARQLEALVRGGATGVMHLPISGTCPESQAPREDAGPEHIALLVESRLPAPRMVVVGANDFGAALLPAAKLLGYNVTVVDARPAFAAQARFSGADEVVTGWPHRYLAAEAAAGHLDRRTVVCILTHDPKFELPLLETALGLDLAYVGAMGSRRGHRQRVEALLAAGIHPERIALLRSPIGLDVGAVAPPEVAVSVMAEIIAASRAATGLPLRDTCGPIHRSPVQRDAAAAPSPPTGAHEEMVWT